VDEIDELRQRVREADARELASRQRDWDEIIKRIKRVEEQLSDITSERDRMRGALTLLRIGYVIVGGVLVELLRKLWPTH
jgi:septation ring formation regulator EzrA